MSKNKSKRPRATVIPHLSKSPQRSHTVDTEKTPKAYPEDWAKHRPSWRISRLDTEGPFGWGTAEQEILCDIRAKLKAFEGMTLGELYIKDKNRNHGVEVSKLSQPAKARLKEIRQDDVDELHTLRLSGKKRVWGILEHNVLNLLWWDPEHKVCPSLKN